jgi:hypothetical protein
VALRAAPGFFRWADLSALGAIRREIRGLHMMGDRFFAVVGASVVEVQRNLALTSFSTINILATLSTTTGKVGMSDNNSKLVIGDGTGFFVLNLDTLVLSQVLDDPGDGEPILGYVSLWIDGTTLYFERDSSKYWYSELNDPTTVKGLSFFSAEFSPDNTVNAYNVNGEIVIRGEVHRMALGHRRRGQPVPAHLGRASGVRLRRPLGQLQVRQFGRHDRPLKQGQGKVYRLGGAGSQPVPISTPAVEKCIEKVLFAFNDVTELITMWAYADAGHDYLVLNLLRSRRPTTTRPSRR